MKSPVHAVVAFALCVCIAGCVTPGASPVTTGTAAANTISANDARDAIRVGMSTRADVMAAIGRTTVVSFDSGFEVWVYRITDDGVTGAAAARASWLGRMLRVGSERELSRGNAEFVVLFAPSGVVAKTRIRHSPVPEAAKGP